MICMFASDIHGSASYCEKMLKAYDQSGAQRLILLGDILYHGPRNDLPEHYAPKEVIRMLNGYKDRIYAVRGNCDTEVDQMVLDFPIMADYGLIALEGKTFYATHGHIYHQDHLPPLQKGDILVHGHTHIFKTERYKEFTVLNPGSVSIPKGGNPHTYALFEGGVFRIIDFEGKNLSEIEL